MARSAIVVGGGIGGLASAVALRQAGVDVLVLERSPELTKVGAGLTLWPNAVKALRRLGLGRPVELAGRVVDEAGFWTWQGEHLGRGVADLLDDRFGAPMVGVHRASLLRVLRAALPVDAVRLGSTVADVTQDGHHVRVRLEDGSSETADVGVGADGLRSILRRHVAGDAAPPRASGLVAWRGVCAPGAQVLERLRPGESYGPGGLFGMLRIDEERVYWWRSARGEERASRGEMEKLDVEGQVRGWATPMAELVHATPGGAVSRTALYDRPPTSRWSSGHLALLGDAAHPMLPFLGQGACQAIEDAEVLADSLAASDDIARGLDLYTQRRHKRTALVQRRSRQAARLGDVRNRAAGVARDLALRGTPPAVLLRQMNPILNYEMNITGPKRSVPPDR